MALNTEWATNKYCRKCIMLLWNIRLTSCEEHWYVINPEMHFSERRTIIIFPLTEWLPPLKGQIHSIVSFAKHGFAAWRGNVDASCSGNRQMLCVAHVSRGVCWLASINLSMLHTNGAPKTYYFIGRHGTRCTVWALYDPQRIHTRGRINNQSVTRWCIA